jgi:hypothetical protein
MPRQRLLRDRQHAGGFSGTGSMPAQKLLFIFA